VSELQDALRELTSPWLRAEAAAAYLGYEVRTFREKIAVIDIAGEIRAGT